MNPNQRKKAIIIFLLVEAFWFCSFLIHEAVHSLSFFILSHEFGEMHILDSVSASFSTIAICIPPQGLIITDHLPLEVLAYSLQCFFTVIFGLFLLKKYYPSRSEDITR